MEKTTKVASPALSEWWRGRKVAVPGGAGFVGSHVVERALRAGARVRVITRHASTANRFLSHVRADVDVVEADCADVSAARPAVRGYEIVLNLAATVAGIAINRTRPAEMFTRNLSVITPVLEAAVAEGVERVLYTSSACVYAGDSSVPTPETEGFLRDPEATNLGYGWAKRVGELAARLYALEYGLHVAVVRPYNAYGPRDDFDPATAHVIPGLIRRAHDEEDKLVVWGSGRQTRSFVYVDDLALGLLLAAERSSTPEPINLGSAEEVSIGDLARLIVELSGKTTPVVFDTSKPDGQMRRQPDLTRAEDVLGFVAPTSLRDGLTHSIDYFRKFILQAEVPVGAR